MIKAIIVDDESKGAQTLCKLIEKYCPSIEITGTADSAKNGAALIQKMKPDLVFLDIEMPGGSGFKMLEDIPKPDFGIIFTTAYDKYAIKAIRFSAFDYLLKPIDSDDLKEAVFRFEEEAAKKQERNGQYNTLLENVNGKKGKLAVPCQEGFLFLDLDKIVRFTSVSNYSRIITTDGNDISSSRPLHTYEAIVEGESFFRIHNSHIINLKHVKKFIRGENAYVLMSDGQEVEISRRKKNEFLEKMAIK